MMGKSECPPYDYPTRVLRIGHWTGRHLCRQVLYVLIRLILQKIELYIIYQNVLISVQNLLPYICAIDDPKFYKTAIKSHECLPKFIKLLG